MLRQISGLRFSPQDYTGEQLGAIGTPTLVFLGDRDALTDIEQAAEMYWHIPNAELAVILNADHFTAAEELANRIVLQFLQRHASAMSSPVPVTAE